MSYIPYKCPECGSDTYRIPRDEDEDRHAYCKECGHDMGDFEKVKEDLVNKGKERLQAGVDDIRAQIAALKNRLK